jgi:hypothetical protein
MNSQARAVFLVCSLLLAWSLGWWAGCAYTYHRIVTGECATCGALYKRTTEEPR